jgi:hypothetical protein
MDEPGNDLDLGGGAAPDPADDPLAGVPSEPIQDVSEAPEAERLGGDGAAIGEEPSAEEVLQEPEESEAGDAEPEPEPEPEPQAEEPAEEPAGEASAPASEPPTGEAAASEPPAKPKAAKKAKTPPREYKVLRITGKEIDSPLKAPVKARNGDDAIKEAYKALAKSAEESMTLVAIPVGYFKPKEVKGREKKDYAVEIN